MNNRGVAGLLSARAWLRLVVCFLLGGVSGFPVAIALEKPAPAGEHGGRGPGHRAEQQHQRGGRGQMRPPGGGRAGHSGFNQLDSNQDGVLSFEEFSKSGRLAGLDVEKQRRLFDFLDRNNDGMLQRHELRPREPRLVGYLRNHFERLDTDQNQSLDFAEFSKAKPLAKKTQAERERMFKRMDADGNGKLEPSELKPPRARGPRPRLDFKKYDADGSGGLNFEEYSKLPFVRRFPEERRKKHFERIDRDGSGEISMDEIRAAHRHRHHRPHRGREGKPPKKRDTP